MTSTSKKIIKSFFIASIILLGLLLVYDNIRPHDFCSTSYLSPKEIDKLNMEAEQGDIRSVMKLINYYIGCDYERNISCLLTFYRKYRYSKDGTVVIWSKSFGLAREQWGLGENTKTIIGNIEILATYNINAQTILMYPYQYGIGMFKRNISRSLYYSKLLGCQEKEPYSYVSYLHTLFHNYPDDKEYLKVAYAMLFFTKLNADKFYKYSNFDALEQNIISRLDRKEIDYVISNYQDIIAKECEGILSDHDQVPTKEKLRRYAFPLKSDNNETIIE
jgi:hypothetical protein